MLPESVLVWAVPFLLFIVALILLYIYGTWTHQTWQSQGVPGPKPAPFFGNTNQLRELGVFQALKKWKNEYGSVYGIYLFNRPMLITDDIDFVKEVFIKDFNNFVSRGNPSPLQTRLNSRNIVSSNGDVWRRQRHTLTPTFSASKLKQMSKFISRCCDNLVDSITKQARAGKPINVKWIFGCYTLDVIAGTGFSLETNSLEDDTNPFLNAVIKTSAAFLAKPRLAVILASVFPFLEPLMRKMGIVNTTAVKETAFIEQSMRNLVAERKKNGKGHVDLLQLMLDSETSEEYAKQHPDEKCLSADEVIAQAIVLFAAGYETTGTLLQYMSYCLAMHPDVQEKLHDQVVASIGEEDPCYESVSKISYLESCIYETLRMYPPAPMFSRMAGSTRTIQGVTIGVDEAVACSVYTLARDEGLYPDPDKFNPDRFEEGGCSSHVPTMIKELPFGCGPRQCIGMRLALYEAKMAMAAVVRKVRFLRIPETPETITFKSARLSAPDRTIYLGAELRGTTPPNILPQTAMPVANNAAK